MFSGMVGYLALGATFLVPARHFAAQNRRGRAIASCIATAGILVGFAGSFTTVLAFTAGAGLGLLWLIVVTTWLMPAASPAQQ